MLPFTGARGLAQAFLRSAAERGISANAAIASLQASGLTTYRRQNILADYRQFLGIEKKAGAIANTRLDYRPSPGLFTMTTGYQRSAFRYQINVRVFKPLTGDTVTIPTNVATDTQLTRRQAEEAGIDAVSGAIDRSEYEVKAITIFAAFAQEGATWD